MAKRTGPTNRYLKELINELKKASATQETQIWKRVANDLSKSSRNRRVVNLSRINRSTQPNETVVVPGKVLGSGNVDHSVVIAAYSFSESAKKSILEAKGKPLTINQLMKDNPKGENVRIIG